MTKYGFALLASLLLLAAACDTAQDDAVAGDVPTQPSADTQGPDAGSAGDVVMDEPDLVDDVGGPLECPDGTIAQQGLCRPVVCQNDLCVEGTLSRCRNEGTTIGAPEACAGHLTCADEAACRESCSEDGHCVDGYICEDGACVTRLTAGAPCDDDARCASGRCLHPMDDGAGQCAAEGESRCLRAGGDGEVEWTDDGARVCEGTGWRLCVHGAWGASVECRGARCEAGQLTPAESCQDGEGCVWTPSAPCPDGLACADERSCRTACSADEHCASADEHCVDGACVRRSCTAGVAYCQDGAVWRCNASGTAFEAAETCGAGQTCVSGACQDHVCTPNASLCQGDAVVTCAADGLSFGLAAACANDQSCVAGGCQDHLCTPSASVCEGNAVVTCAADGLSQGAPVACGANESCMAGACQDRVCTPNATLCQGDAVATCAADGLSWGAALDCTDSQTCVSGACQDHVCVPNQALCQGNAVVVCAADGLTVGAPDACSAEQTCVAGTCRDHVCEPDLAFCQGNTVITCASDGLSFGAANECTSGQTCVAGSCEDHVCVPNSVYCQDDAVVTCAADGLSFSAPSSCPAEQYCRDGACQAQACTPGASACSGDALFVCADNGSGYELLEACGENQYCADGACHDQICEPDGASCSGNTLMTCNVQGSGYASMEDCGALYCHLDACAALLCRPDETGCLDGQLVTCSEDGMSWGDAQSCGAGLVCAVGACVTPLCDVDERRCVDDATVQRCGDERLSWVEDETCAQGEVCLAGVCELRTSETDEDFETGDLTRFPWQTSGDHPWLVADGEGRDDSFAVRSDPEHPASTSACVSIEQSWRDIGPLTFWMKLETEEDHYEVVFLVDDVEQARYSGVSDWTQIEHDVPLGPHTLAWCYERDDFVSTEHPMRNSVWIDDVHFPVANTKPTVPELLWPFDNFVLTESWPLLQWESEDLDEIDSIVYELQLATARSFPASRESSSNLTVPRYHPSTELQCGQTYWWRVRARDNFDGLFGAWSRPYSFTVDSSGPRMFWAQVTEDQLATGTLEGPSAPDNVTTLVSPPIRFADIEGALRWDQVQWTGAEDILLRLRDGDGDLVAHTDLPGNGAGFFERSVPLWNLDPDSYPVLRLEAVLPEGLSDEDLTRWSVTWGSALRWDFENPDDAEQWVCAPDTLSAVVTVADGALRFESDGEDPNLTWTGIDIDASDFTELEVRLRSGNTSDVDTVSVSWANEAGGFESNQRVSAGVFLLDWQTVVFDLTDASSGQGAWTGTISDLRIDPVEAFEGGAGWFEIDTIVLR